MRGGRLVASPPYHEAMHILAAVALGVNLLANPGAEQSVENAITGWTANMQENEAAETQEYGHVSGEWDWNIEGTPHGAKHYFRLSWEHGDERAMTQTVNVAPLMTAIDKADVTATISGALGEFLESDTTTQIAATFFDGANKELGRVETKPTAATALKPPAVGGASMTTVSNSALVPKGTRTIRFSVTAKAAGDSANYAGFADNLSLVLTEPPPPKK